MYNEFWHYEQPKISSVVVKNVISGQELESKEQHANDKHFERFNLKTLLAVVKRSATLFHRECIPRWKTVSKKPCKQVHVTKLLVGETYIRCHVIYKVEERDDGLKCNKACIALHEN